MLQSPGMAANSGRPWWLRRLCWLYSLGWICLAFLGGLRVWLVLRDGLLLQELGGLRNPALAGLSGALWLGLCLAGLVLLWLRHPGTKIGLGGVALVCFLLHWGERLSLPGGKEGNWPFMLVSSLVLLAGQIWLAYELWNREMAHAN